MKKSGNCCGRIQRNEKYKRDYVKVTIVLMLDLGETPQKIALFLGIDVSNVYRHLESYQTTGLDAYLENNYSGYWGLPQFTGDVEIARRVEQSVV